MLLAEVVVEHEAAASRAGTLAAEDIGKLSGGSQGDGHAGWGGLRCTLDEEGTSGEIAVTEAEWLVCTDPAAMLNYLRDWASDRKLRLFAVACCRRFWRKLQDKRSKQAVAVSECYADGMADKKELASARSGAVAANNDAVGWDAVTRTRQKDWDAPTFIAWCTAREMIGAAATELMRAYWHLGWQKRDPANDQARQTKLLHDIFGNLFRPVTIPPAVLAWHDSTVVRLAQAAYDDRHLPSGTLDNGRLAVLADALEEAGCTDTEILGHLRGPGPHVRGCWPVDLCLGKS